MEKISKHISYKEATRSQTAERYGIRNHPSDRQIKVMENLANNVFECIREHFGKPLFVSSFFRCTTLNKKLRGAKHSDHMVSNDTAAIDIDNDVFEDFTNVSNADIFWYVFDNLDYYKLIWEFGDDDKPAWVHISYSTDSKKNKRKQTYRAVRKNGRVSYKLFKDFRNQ